MNHEKRKTMPTISVTFNDLTQDQAVACVSAVAGAGILGTPSITATPTQAPGNGVARPPAAAPAAPAAPAPPRPAAPPPPAPAAAAPTGKIAQAMQAMDGYAKSGHGMAGCKKVIALCGIARLQDANDEQLDWLITAFSDHTFVAA